MMNHWIGQPRMIRITPTTIAAPDRQRHREPQAERVGALAARVARDRAAVGRDVRRLRGDGDQRGLGDGGGEPQQEGEGEQPRQAALSRESNRHRLADREQPQLQTPDEQRQTHHHEHRADQDAAEVGSGWRRTTIWKNATTATMGSRFRTDSARSRTNSAAIFWAVPTANGVPVPAATATGALPWR